MVVGSAGASGSAFGEGTAEEEQFKERLRRTLSGTDASSRVVRASAAAGDMTMSAQTRGNLLMGASLHAALRFAYRLELSDLEAPLLEMMRTGMTDQAIWWTGGVYEGMKNSGEPILTVPEVITSLPTERPYTFADLERDAPAMIADYLRRPNVAVNDRESLAFGGEVDSPAFIEGMCASGTGSGAFWRPGGSGLTLAAPDAAAGTDNAGDLEGTTAPTPPPPFRARLEAVSFRVLRECGDQWNTADDIYWTGSAGSDQQAGSIWRSNEFSPAKEGQTYPFHGNNVVADLSVGSRLGLSLHCWEADQSNAEWYDALTARLNWLCDEIFSNPGFQIGSNLPGGEVAGWIADITQLFAFMLERFRNNDDLSAARGVVLDRYDLAILAQRRDPMVWHFNGDGHHALTVRYAGDQVPFHPGTLEYVVHDGRKWCAPIPVPWESATPPGLVDYLTVLHAVFLRPSDNALMWSKLQNQVWTEPRRIHNLTAAAAPAMVQHGLKLRVVVIGTDQAPVTVTYDAASGWSQPQRLDGHRADKLAPALEHRLGRVYLTYVADGGTKLRHTELADGTWSSPESWPVDVADPASLEFTGSTLLRAHRGREDSRFHLYARGTNGAWQPRGSLGGWELKAGPTLVNHTGGLWAILRGANGRLYTAQYDGSAWNTPQEVPGNALPIRESAASAPGGKLYVMYHR
ncbi:hypothetical protein [Yinghuangia seranimata]|uniref:hypothetical protein n=1 Tax=Yinghuangia seranimata TaxID=408067 RepID=UPI00248BFC66|nr:hypothetical protein [Yinghuangia seranimata]MDI2125424.1 hypothetical protein [Yinghuangia seranimata]